VFFSLSFLIISQSIGFNIKIRITFDVNNQSKPVIEFFVSIKLITNSIQNFNEFKCNIDLNF